MQIPPLLRAAIDETLNGHGFGDLQRDFQQLSAAYARGRGESSFVDSEKKVLAYIATRMPSIYVVLRAILGEIESRFPETPPRSLIDVGAGPGTVLWAASQIWETLCTVRLFDHSALFRNVGQRLVATSGHHLKEIISWEELDLRTQPLSLPASVSLPASADLVTASYVLGELSAPAQRTTVLSLWAATDRWLTLVEPGTPDGFRRILEARSLLLEQGAHIVAPCAAANDCPLPAHRWCHFTRRVERTRAQRAGKAATLGFEDEPYSFLICSKIPPPPIRGRVLSTPTVLKHEASIELCNNENKLTKITARKSSTPARYRELAKKYRWGDFVTELSETDPI
jgi:ribosomal protein RSM22 (predicted rRNA methylase)